MKRLLLSLCLVLGLATPLWASEEIGRQEDTANASGQVLMPIGCVRQDTIANSTAADANYGNIKCNNVGRMYTSAAIDTALPAGTNAIGKLSANGGVIIGDVNLVSAIPAGGNTIGGVNVVSSIPGTGATNLGKAEGGTHVNADTGVFTLCVRHDTSTTGLGADGTYAACGLNASGEVYTAANTELPAAAALADNTSNPTVPGVAAFMMCFDGTTWDRCLPGLSDTDDNSVAFSQVTSLIISENHLSDGTSWVREIAYLEDAASAGGEQLKIVGAIRRNTPGGDTSADGDFGSLIIDSLNRLYVNCAAGCSVGASTPADAFANPTTANLNMTFNMGFNGTTWDRLLVDASKFLKVNCAAGCSSGATTPADAFANPTTAALNMVFPVGWNGATWDRLQVDGSKFLKINCAAGCAGGSTTPSDAFANPTTAGLQMTFPTGWNGSTWDRLQVDGSKNLKVLVNGAIAAGSNTIGNVNPGTAANWGVYVEDGAETAGGNLMMAGSVRRDTAATSSNATGDNSTMNTDALGLLWTRSLDPCTGVAKTYIAINISTATTTELTPSLAGASTNYYVCSINLVTAAANNVALTDDDTDNCVSVTSGLAGGTTAASGWNFPANGGISHGNGHSSVFKTAGANRVLCLVTSAATQLSGSITVAAAP